MKKENLTKVAVAVALLFAVNMEADAQFGNLLNKANSPANIERRAMPKAGSLNSQLHAAALAIAKKRMQNVVDVVITRDQWDIKRNALGVILYRVAYGYYIVKDEQGRKAVSHSWAQDYQGGKYGSLRHFGVGAEGSFYVK